jgi:hypothetical protein
VKLLNYGILLSYGIYVYESSPMERVDIHPRVRARHPELSDRDVRDAWYACIRSAPRLDTLPTEYIAVGLDGTGRLIEMVAIRLADHGWLVYHAMTPPSKKTLKELRLTGPRRAQR